jgi:hypothetical protein
MADIPPSNPGAPMGAMPPTKKETGKVQPKKETVRINLPPKPTAAPTIKLPTLPPGGPTGASSGMPLQPTPTAATTLRSSATPAAQPRPGAAAPVAATAPAPAGRRPAAAPVATAKISPIDKILAIAAAVVALAAIGTTVWMLMILNDALQQ